MFQVILIIMVVLATYRVHADPSISTSTPTPCYGDVVTLVCHHPEVASNPGRYFGTRPTWREDGKIIDITDGTIYSDETVADLTRSFVNITLAADYFRNEPLKYSCELVLADNGLPGKVETSENVTVDPVAPQPPSGINIINISTTNIVLNWTHIPIECYKDRISYLMYWVSIDNYTESGFNDTGEHMYNITGLVGNNTYTVSVWAVGDGSVQSMPVSRNVTTASGLMPPPSPPLADNLLHHVLIIVVVVLVGGGIVGLIVFVGVCLWRKWKSRGIEPLWLLQITDALNRNGVKIISVRGHCVSAKCDPCCCVREATTVDIYGTFNEKSFVMTSLKSGEDNMEGFIAELLQQKHIMSADYYFALWAGDRVPRKVWSQFKKKPEWRSENCTVLAVQGFLWKVGSKEEKRFVELFKRSIPPPNIEIEAMHHVSLGLSSQEEEGTSAVEESEQVTVTIPHSDPPQVDVVKLVELLLISKPPTTEEADGDVKIPLKSDNASVTASPLGKYGSVSSPFTDSPISKQDTSEVSDGRRRSYTRSAFIDGVVSVLDILHVTILSVGRKCRRLECRDANSCTHLDTFQPDVVGVIRDASIVIKCVLHRHDGDVTGDHMATLDSVRTGLGFPLGLLVYDHMEGDPRLLSQQIPTGCLLVHVGAFTWDSNWVKCTLIALCKAFKTPLAMDTCPPVHQVQYTPISVEKNCPVPNPSMEKTNYSEISAIGEKAAQLVEDKPPPVPPKKETNPMEEQFQTDVIEALTEIGMTLHSRELNFFTATYQSMEFLGVSRVESEEDITPADVEEVVRAKTKMAASRAVLICIQDTIPMDRLINLQEDSCYFIKAGGYGTEKWKNRLISNFKETVGDWMKEQNPRPHHSMEDRVILEEDKGVLHSEEKEVVGHPEKQEVVGHPEKQEVVGHPEKQEVVGHTEKEEEVVGHSEEESGLSQLVEEAGAPGRYGAVKVNDDDPIIRKPPITGTTRLNLKFPARLDDTPQPSTLQHDGQRPDMAITDAEKNCEPEPESGQPEKTVDYVWKRT